MASHHIHHVLPKHMGGGDEEENLVVLTVEEHALAHEALWKKYGQYGDYLAYRMLSGQIAPSEASRLAKLEGCRSGGRANKGIPKKYTPESRARLRTKQRIAHLGQPAWNKGKTGIYSERTLQALRDARKKQVSPMKGRRHTAEAKARISAAKTGKPWSAARRASYERGQNASHD